MTDERSISGTGDTVLKVSFIALLLRQRIWQQRGIKPLGLHWPMASKQLFFQERGSERDCVVSLLIELLIEQDMRAISCLPSRPPQGNGHTFISFLFYFILHFLNKI